MKTIHKMKGNYISLISVIFILLVGMALPGCADVARYEEAHQRADASRQKAVDARQKSDAFNRDLEERKAVDTLSYVRQHKGEGTRRVVMGNETELMDMAVKEMETANLEVIRESHAVFGNATTVNMTYAFYFYPSQTNGQTEMEVLLYSPWGDAERNKKFQFDVFNGSFFLGYIKIKLLENDYDPNIREGNSLALSVAAIRGDIEIADKLIKKGAKVDLAVDELKKIASGNSLYLDKPANKNAYEKANSAIHLLESGVDKLLDAKREEVEKENNSFHKIVLAYQKKAVKPQLPEDARRFKVQAEGAVRDKEFTDAVGLYGQALKIAPWWPEGHFNRALVLGEVGQFEAAIFEMKRYLLLSPDAPNARAAQDKIYVWERKAGKGN